MRVYELTIILNPNLDKEAVNSELDKLTGMVEKADGTVFEVQHLGMRRTTFELRGFTQGNYYTIYFNSVPEVLTEMDKSMKLNENVLRTMTIVLKQSVYEAGTKKKAEDEKAPMGGSRRPSGSFDNSRSDDGKSDNAKSDENQNDEPEQKPEVVENGNDEDEKE